MKSCIEEDAEAIIHSNMTNREQLAGTPEASPASGLVTHIPPRCKLTPTERVFLAEMAREIRSHCHHIYCELLEIGRLLVRQSRSSIMAQLKKKKKAVRPGPNEREKMTMKELRQVPRDAPVWLEEFKKMVKRGRIHEGDDDPEAEQAGFEEGETEVGFGRLYGYSGRRYCPFLPRRYNSLLGTSFARCSHPRLRLLCSRSEVC